MLQKWLTIFLLAAVAAASEDEAAFEDATASRLCPPECACRSETIECVTAGLTQPPVGLWVDVQSLELTNNNITTLYPFSFTGFPSLSSLYLSSNRIAQLDFEPFAPLRNLTYLSLWGNGLSTVLQPPSEMQMLALTELDLSNNKISSLDPDILASVAPNLKYLFFTDNPLFVLKDGPVLSHPKLEHVSFLRTNMSAVTPQTFQRLPNLKVLILSDAGVRNITEAFVSSPQLQFLELGRCAVTEVAAGSFAAEEALGYLSLGANPLKRLDLSAVEFSVKSGGYLQISDTPLACACGYQDIHNWAKNKTVSLDASCEWTTECSISD